MLNVTYAGFAFGRQVELEKEAEDDGYLEAG